MSKMTWSGVWVIAFGYFVWATLWLVSLRIESLVERGFWAGLMYGVVVGGLFGLGCNRLKGRLVAELAFGVILAMLGMTHGFIFEATAGLAGSVFGLTLALTAMPITGLVFWTVRHRKPAPEG